MLLGLEELLVDKGFQTLGGFLLLPNLWKPVVSYLWFCAERPLTASCSEARVFKAALGHAEQLKEDFSHDLEGIHLHCVSP